MNKLLNILLCFLLTLNFGYSQSIKRNVISSFGASSNTANSIVETTFGQPPNIGTISDGNNYVRQGFQQPLYNFISIPGCTDSTAVNYNPSANTDDGSCTYGITIDTAFISQPILCFGGAGDMQIDINQTNPASTYSVIVGHYMGNPQPPNPGTDYFISHITTNITQTTQLNLVGFSPNVDYFVRVVDSIAYYNANGGASGTSAVDVYDEYGPIIYTEPAELNATSIVVDPSCYGLSDGIVTINISGGTPNYTLNAFGNSWTFGGTSFVTSLAVSAGSYPYNIVDANNCLFNDVVNVSEPALISSTDNVITCENYTWIDGNTYTSNNNTAIHTTQAINGCDSVISLDLIINNNTSINTTITACDSYTWSVNGTTYLTSGTYTDISTNAAGCTHTDSLVLTINNSTSSSATITACDSYTWSVTGSTYSTSGIYTDISTNAAGCTHADSLVLTINNSTSSNATITACDSYTWSVNGTTYLTSGTFSTVSTNAAGCTHTDSLVLTINNSTSSSATITACDSYTWSVTGSTYSTSGTYSTVSTNSAGCTHTETLVLTINDSTSNSTIITACDTYLWNAQTITTSGSYNQTFTNVAGCDSVHTLVATINYSNTGTTSITACDSYLWNAQTITTSGSYNQTFTNVAGCDSVHTLVATINYSNTGTTSITACDSYLWNAQTITTSGSYNQTFTNVAGCDSIHTLNITIIFSTLLYDTVSICNGESYVVSNSTYYNTGDYIDTIFTSDGCLSMIYTNLTVGSSLNSSITQVGNILESTVNGGFMPYSYLWNTLDISENINIFSSGLYWLVVTDSLSCPVDTAYYNGVLHTSISEIGISDLKVYPNPSRDIFNIVFSSNTIQNLDVRVLNVVGEVIISEDLDQFIGEYTKQINLHENAKGIYFLEIETNDGIINKKLILQ